MHEHDLSLRIKWSDAIATFFMQQQPQKFQANWNISQCCSFIIDYTVDKAANK